MLIFERRYCKYYLLRRALEEGVALGKARPTRQFQETPRGQVIIVSQSPVIRFHHFVAA